MFQFGFGKSTMALIISITVNKFASEQLKRSIEAICIEAPCDQYAVAASIKASVNTNSMAATTARKADKRGFLPVK
jgi:hypothetical protein